MSIYPVLRESLKTINYIFFPDFFLLFSKRGGKEGRIHILCVPHNTRWIHSSEMQIDPKLRGLQTSFISPSHYKFIYFWQNCKLSRKIIPESPYTLSYIFNKDTVFEKYLRPFEIRTVRNLHFFLSKNSTLISREYCRFFLGKKLVKMWWFWTV